mmetsp:Transcript_27329/g.81574  ORF Transcript_27329/g.81574 Transcript_27329/m.81574 type:complete len:225 (+) Transcript_27329:622-1296(+)
MPRYARSNASLEELCRRPTVAPRLPRGRRLPQLDIGGAPPLVGRIPAPPGTEQQDLVDLRSPRWPHSRLLLGSPLRLYGCPAPPLRRRRPLLDPFAPLAARDDAGVLLHARWPRRSSRDILRVEETGAWLAAALKQAAQEGGVCLWLERLGPEVGDLKQYVLELRIGQRLAALAIAGPILRHVATRDGGCRRRVDGEPALEHHVAVERLADGERGSRQARSLLV